MRGFFHLLVCHRVLKHACLQQASAITLLTSLDHRADPLFNSRKAVLTGGCAALLEKQQWRETTTKERNHRQASILDTLRRGTFFLQLAGFSMKEPSVGYTH